MAKKRHKAIGTVPELIEKRIYEELISFYPELGTESYLTDCLIRCVEKTGRQFVFMYDGYDFPEVGAIYNPHSVMLAMRKTEQRIFRMKRCGLSLKRSLRGRDQEKRLSRGITGLWRRDRGSWNQL